MMCIRLLFLILFLTLLNDSLFAQVKEQKGNLFAEIESIIDDLPGRSGEDYQSPRLSDLMIWESMLAKLLLEAYDSAAILADQVGYDLIAFEDQANVPSKVYYLLKSQGRKYWGTYIFNPSFCRSLVIQAPHPKNDLNTGVQGMYIFLETEALFYALSGTHRCNSTELGVCDGSTTSCTSSPDDYPVSDLSHNINTVFQKSTDLLARTYSDSYFIQLHGFSKRSSDPYMILSNGNDNTPVETDYLSIFRDEISKEDPTLSFEIAHLNLNWTRLRGFTNTQGRLLNGSADPCEMEATSNSGRFFHIEQALDKLRRDQTGWDKVAQALSRTFSCLSTSTNKIPFPNTLEIFPNPSYEFIQVQSDAALEAIQIFDTYGRLHLEQAQIFEKRIRLDISRLPTGIYFLKQGTAVHKFSKK